MTYDEIMDKWGEVIVKFSHYYKYKFHFRGVTPEGDAIGAVYGGDSSDIYRFELANDEQVKLEYLCADEIIVCRGDDTLAYWSSY